MKTIIGIILMLTGLVFGLWLGVEVLFVGGIVDIINQIKAPELSVVTVAWGLVKIIFAPGVGLIIVIALISPGWRIVINQSSK